MCKIGNLLQFGLLAAPLFIATSASAQEIHYTLLAEHFDCLVENRKTYIAADKENLLIPLTECPELPERPLSLLNSGAPSTVDLGNEVDSFIYVSKDQFSCIFIAGAKAQTEIIRIFPLRCEFQ